MDFNELGTVIRDARKKAGMSQADLQDSSGINRARISLIESGDVSEIGWSKVMSIFSALGLDVACRPAGTPPQLDEIVSNDDNTPSFF